MLRIWRVLGLLTSAPTILRAILGHRITLPAAILLALAFHNGTAAAEAKPAKPNILFLFTDDQRADTIGALGNPVIKTPSLDSLARRGFVFLNAYCLGGNVGAVCTPSRNMLLSGKTYFRWRGLQAPGDPPNFPLTMKDAGYATYHHGKRNNSALNIQAQFEINKYLANLQEERTDGEPGRSIVDAAITYLDQRDLTRPFFMYLAFGNPHDPRIAAPKYMHLYRREQIPLPKNFLPVHPFDNGEMTVRDELLTPWPRTEAEIRRHLHEYYAVISGLDYHIGRLLEALKARKLLDNTLIIFSSDQGLAIGSHGLMGKQNLYEDGMKVPLIFAGPGIPKGKSEALVYLHDIYPTVCELAGAALPPNLDGRSFKPVLDGKSAATRETLFLAYKDVQRALRDREWKLIRYPQINRTQLFNLRDDPDEIRDLSANTAQAARIADMMDQLQAWQRQLGDTAPLSVASPRPAQFTPPTGEAFEKLRRALKMENEK